MVARVPEPSEGESGVEGDVADANEEGKGRAAEEAEGERSSVIDQLVADDAIEEENPCGGRNGADVDGAECLCGWGWLGQGRLKKQRIGRIAYQPHFIVQWELSDREDFTYRDEKVSQKECLYFPAKMVSLQPCNAHAGLTDLRPTAARFLSERSNRRTVTTIAMPLSIIDPAECQLQQDIG